MSENFQEQAESILESLGLFLGLEDLEFGEEDDTCTLQLDQKTRVNITCNSENDTLVLHHLMGTLPQSGERAQIVEQLLEANLFWSGTNGATISLERETGLVIIARALPIMNSEGKLLSGEALATAIADLASASNYWKRLLEQEAIEKEDPEASARMIEEASSSHFLDITALN